MEFSAVLLGLKKTGKRVENQLGSSVPSYNAIKDAICILLTIHVYDVRLQYAKQTSRQYLRNVKGCI